MRRIKYLIAIILSFLVLSSCNSLRITNCTPIYAMDTTINITFYNVEDYKNHYDQIKKIYQNVDKLTGDFEDYEGQNGIYDLNVKRTIKADELLVDIVKSAISMIDKTNGYYNPFMGRLTHLWKTAIKNGKLVEDETIQSELKIIEQTSIEIKDDTITLLGDGNLDLGAIAKGYATELAQQYLSMNKIDGYLINAGNSSLVYGSKVNDDFKIALTKPYENGNIYIILDKNNAIGTSSGRYQHALIDGVLYHHLINPFTGYPATTYDSVNVKTNNSILCDVYSTAIMAMSLDEAINFADSENIDIILFKDKVIYQTEGWKIYA